MTDVAVFLKDEINKQIRADALNILTGVVLATPVDTGRARGNWQASLSAPIKAEIKRIDKSGQSAINAGNSEIGKARDVEYPVIFITNNLPYISALNAGTSDQAPEKFVETVIKKVMNR